MTPEREYDDIDLKDTLASATEFTGMLPAITTHNDPEALAAAMDVPCPVIAAREDPARSPLTGGSEHLSGAHNPRRTTPNDHPARESGPFHRD